MVNSTRAGAPSSSLAPIGVSSWYQAWASTALVFSLGTLSCSKPMLLVAPLKKGRVSLWLPS